jgi:hypothetical protein
LREKDWRNYVSPRNGERGDWGYDLLFSLILGVSLSAEKAYSFFCRVCVNWTQKLEKRVFNCAKVFLLLREKGIK